MQNNLHSSGTQNEQIIAHGSIGSETKRKIPSPEDARLNIFSRITFWHVWPLLKKGFRQYLELDDIPEVPKVLFSMNQSNYFEQLFENYKTSLEQKKRKFSNFQKFNNSTRDFLSFWRMIFQAFSKYFVLGLYNIPRLILTFIQPILIQYLLQQLKSEESTAVWIGIALSITLFFVSSLNSTIQHHFFHDLNYYWVRVQTCLQVSVFHKIIKIAPSSRQDFSFGEIVNLMSVDCKRVGFVFVYLHFIWFIAAVLVFSVILIFYFVQFSVFAGVGAMLLLLPLGFLVARYSNKGENQISKHKDERVKLMNEILFGMRLIKYQTWETRFKNLIDSIRKKEYRALLFTLILYSTQEFISIVIPIVGSSATFICYTLLGNELTAEVVFPTITLFNILAWPLLTLPEMLNSVLQAWVSSRRIFRFLKLDEVDVVPQLSQVKEALANRSNQQLEEPEEDVTVEILLDEAEQDATKKKKMTISDEPYSENRDLFANIDTITAEEEELAVCIKSASFSYKKAEDEEWKSLAEESVSVSPNQGDNINNSSSGFMLQDVDLQVKKGSLVFVIGKVASGKTSLLGTMYGDLHLQSGSIWCNGKLAYCSQSPFIINASIRENILFGNEFDEIKYWNVVKACQLETDFEQFAAKDTTEIGENGINLSGGQKARISLARACYSNADIILLDSVLNALDAHVQRQIFEDCIVSLLQDKTRIIVLHTLHFLPRADWIVEMKQGTIADQGTYQDLLSRGSNFIEYASEEEKAEEEEEEIEEVKEQKSTATQEIDNKERDTVDSSKSKLTVKEDRRTGNVSLKIWFNYFAGYGIFWLFAIMTSGLLSTGAQIGLNGWLSVWTSNWIQPNPGTLFYLLIYGGIGLMACVCIIINNFSFIFGSLNSSNHLHQSMLHSILRAPIAFFDENPTGRILNRFAKDQYAADFDILINVSFMFKCLLQGLGILVLISFATPWFLLCIIPIGIAFYLVQLFYRKTSREVKRLESICNSPLISHFSTLITGSSTIRAYELADKWNQKNHLLIDEYNKCLWSGLVLNRWLGLQLQILSSSIVLAASLLAIVSSRVDAAFAGLSISYSISISNQFVWLVRSLVSVESGMTSVERIAEYGKIPSEAAVKTSVEPPAVWPEKGQIQVDNLIMRYRPHLDPVIKGISFQIQEGEKISLVGRTGSGKSSLLSAFFRMVEPWDEGSIIIDGYNIQEMGLEDLRSKLIIIPQDAILFSGTIRSNIDPFDECSDEQIWRTLERVHMKQQVSNYPNQLYEQVSESGNNMSAGEKQLLAMARQLLKPHKTIIFLDEISANVDVESDRIIQETIRQEFKSSTVITIAHRLDTVIDSDRVMVMDQGKIVEFASPHELLLNDQSYFSQLVNQTGAVHAQRLKQLAMQRATSSQE